MHIWRSVFAAVAVGALVTATPSIAAAETAPATEATSEAVATTTGEAAEAASHGSAFVTHSSAGTEAWSTTGIPPTVTALTPGSWRVRLPGITALGGGLVVTSAPGVVSPTCSVDKVALHNGATAIWVRCFRNGNQPADGFNLTYTSVRRPDQAWWRTTSTTFGPSTFSSVYNPGGGVVTGSLNNIAGGAKYFTTLAGATPFSDLNRRWVTPIGPGYVQCFSDGWSTSPGISTSFWTRCRDGNAQYVGARHASYLFGDSLLPNVAGKSARVIVTTDPGTNPPHVNLTWPSGNSGTITASRAGVGITQIRLSAGATAKPGISHTVSLQVGFGYRCPSMVADSGSAAVITVYCYDAYGNPSDGDYQLVYFSPN